MANTWSTEATDWLSSLRRHDDSRAPDIKIGFWDSGFSRRPWVVSGSEICAAVLTVLRVDRVSFAATL